MSEISISTTVDFKIDGEVHTLKKITRSRYEKFAIENDKANDMEDEKKKQSALLNLTESLILESGYPKEKIKDLPFEAFDIIITNLVKKSQ